MGRRRKGKGNQSGESSLKGEASDDPSGKAAEGIVPMRTVSSADVESVIFRKIDEIRAEQMRLGFSESRTLGSVCPSWLPCPGYRCQPKGLVNTRNTCYLLTCLQTLFCLPPFVAILHHISVAVHSFFAEVGCLRDVWLESQAETVPLLRLLLLHLDERTPYKPSEVRTGEPILPNDFGYLPTGKPLSLDPKFFTVLNFEVGCEQDAADCMSRLITQVHEEMATLLCKFKQPEDEAFTEDNGDGDDNDGWTTVTSEGKKIKEARHAQVDNGEVTPISLLFGGTLVSRSSYQKNSRLPNKLAIDMKERFFVLPIELQDPQVGYLEDGFQFLSRGEVLSDFKDPVTGLCVIMNRRVFIDRLPPILLVQLKRFFYDSNKGGIQKVLKQIPIHRRLQIVDSIVSKERTFSKAQGAYKLKAVVFHIGYNAERGHYTAATVAQTNEVLYYDDLNVFRLGQEEEVWMDMFASHRPFDTHSARCRPLPRAQSTAVAAGAALNRPPSIGEQPRTPYLLVYVSCFQQQSQRQQQRQ
ncbi:ubiquitin specific peptidase c family [Echinococcus multilocularis]|uniref:ubiquitinyl hydrolase 1 n=1 Tax=Echinococcus multilocularis TaxID=6211 RepID=A0A087W0F1_ECHMU|nr:ubiquitin specific peptidase c family [Echinococcus multilocularis]